MNRFLFVLLLNVLFIPVFAGTKDAEEKNDPSLEPKVKGWIQKNAGLRFLENKGQMADKNLLFKASGGGADFYVTTWGLSYVFNTIEKSAIAKLNSSKNIQGRDGRCENECATVKYCRADMELVGADIRKENIIKENESEDRIDYYLPKCLKGALNVHSYEKITVKNIYPGIDWVVYQNNRDLNTQQGIKYDFVVQPGADPSLIKLKYKWADKPVLQKNGSIKISTPMGDIVEGIPISGQYPVGGTGPGCGTQEWEPVETRYKLTDDKISFSLSKYDPNKTLVIDPTLIWATYFLGGGGTDDLNEAYSISDDGSHVWVTGISIGTPFPVANPGLPAYFQGNSAGYYDVVIFEFNTCGQLIWSTFYGGSYLDWGNSISSDGTNVWVTGYTSSTDFPTHDRGSGDYYQPALGGFFYNSSNAFILQFSCTDNSLIWATYDGGNSYDKGYSISSDGTNVWLTGSASSTNFPVKSLATAGVYNQSVPGAPGATNAFVSQFSCANSSLVWCSYYGGSGYDVGCSINSDRSNVWVTGGTSSSNFPLQALAGAYTQPGPGGANTNNAFVLQFNCLSSVRTWATYYGGNEAFAFPSGLPGIPQAKGTGLSINSDGNSVWLTGLTAATDFPVKSLATVGVYNQSTPGAAGATNAFISQFSCANSSLVWATYYGGNGVDFGSSIQSDKTSVWVCGGTSSPDFPTLPSACGSPYQSTLDGGTQNIFILQLNTSAVLEWATYYGEDIENDGSYISSDGTNLFLAGDLSPGASYPIMDPGNGAYMYSTAPAGPGAENCILAKFAISCTGSSGTLSTSPDTTLCNGGAAPLRAGGADSYSWSPSTNLSSTSIANPIATPTVTTTYTVTGTFSSGCASGTSSSTVTITVSSPIIVTPQQISPASCGISNGSADVSVAGGTVPYNYTWSIAATGQTISGEGAGSYTVTVTDANSCSASQSVPINSSPGPTISGINPTPVLCYGNSTGTLTVTASGSGTLTYSWSNGVTSQSGLSSPFFNSLLAGSYTVTVTDGKGCLSISPAVITQPASVLSASTAATNPSCGNANGSIVVTPVGGTGTYNYVWSTTSTGPSASNLAGNATYTVTVTDANGCTATSTSALINQAGGSATLSVTNPILCNGATTGSITATVNSSSSPYTYNWSSGISGSTSANSSLTASGLSSAAYSVTITDANGCSAASSVVLTQPLTPVNISSISPSNPKCSGGSGSAIASVSGGTGILTYNWSSGGTGATENNLLTSGTYTVTVLDANACSATSTVSITIPSPISFSAAQSSPATCDKSNGAAVATAATGGTGSFSYNWSSGVVSGSGLQDSGLGAGTYTVTATDGNGCTQTATVGITSPGTPLFTAPALTEPKCFGQTGSAKVSATGGSGTLTYNWSNAISGQTDSGLAANTYTVTVSDATGCTVTQSITITAPPLLTAAANATSTCPAKTDGSFSVSISGGTPSYAFLWSNGIKDSSGILSSGAMFQTTGLGTGLYTITVTDANGCTATSTATIDQFTGITPGVNISDTTIQSGQRLQFIAAGGVSYLWSPSAGLSSSIIYNPIADPSSNTTYTVVITDGNNCSAKDSIIVIVTEPIPCDSSVIARSVFLPSAFSPNNDGQNDILYLRIAQNSCIASFTLNIYDRWGEMVFSTTSPENGWNGTFRGEKLNAAVYVYYLNLTLTNYKNISSKGNISLLR